MELIYAKLDEVIFLLRGRNVQLPVEPVAIIDDRDLYNLKTGEAAKVACVSDKTLIRDRAKGKINSVPPSGHGCRFSLSGAEKLKLSRFRNN